MGLNWAACGDWIAHVFVSQAGKGGLEGEIVREWSFLTHYDPPPPWKWSFHSRGMSQLSPITTFVTKLLVFVPFSQVSSPMDFKSNLICSYRFSKRRSRSLIGRTSPAQPPAWCHFPLWPYTSLLRYAEASPWIQFIIGLRLINYRFIYRYFLQWV